MSEYRDLRKTASRNCSLGATKVEYVLLLSLIAIASVLSLQLVAGKANFELNRLGMAVRDGGTEGTVKPTGITFSGRPTSNNANGDLPGSK